LLGCSKFSGSHLTSRHDAIKLQLAAAFRKVDARVEVERSAHGPERIRPDLTVSASASMMHIDVSVVHPLAPSNIAAADRPNPQHITRREARKRIKYNGIAEADAAVFLPAVVDTLGMYGEGMHEVIRRLKDVADEVGSDQGSAVVAELKETLPFTIQRGNVRAAMRGLAEAERLNPPRLVIGHEARRMLQFSLPRMEEKGEERKEPPVAAVQLEQNPVGNVQAATILSNNSEGKEAIAEPDSMQISVDPHTLHSSCTTPNHRNWSPMKTAKTSKRPCGDGGVQNGQGRNYRHLISCLSRKP
ncbi:MAG: hypothetical protein ABL994_25895, partial [Verrucomicrobiales bacterium]